MTDASLSVHHLGEGHTMVRVASPQNLLLLPVQESAGESAVSMIVDNQMVNRLDVRMAVDQVDYYVPVDISLYKGQHVVFNFARVADEALCWQNIQLADTFDDSNVEKFRPVYHFSPRYGWMNDPNGMVYKDGQYHLFYQYNPYGSVWGNMHWGHAVSPDLVHWEYRNVAIAPDALGTIFSGSCVVDKDNTAGFGAGAIVAFYTSAGERQTQSIAYSLDNGETFIKYDANPVVSASVPDFRDPKVIWHEPTQKWVMILAAGQEMQIYSSSNLKEWELESNFGEDQGAHGGVWECPDLIELPVEGTSGKKWVLICNINPGGPFGGSATQYFTGTFDGKTFVNESPALTKWMDWGKDHYATVTWSNAPDHRHIAIAWMSNWQYANEVPTRQFRSSNSIPRDLSLYTYQGETYLRSSPSPEMETLRGNVIKKNAFSVSRTTDIKELLKGNEGTYEIEMTIRNKDADLMGFRLYNALGEEVNCIYNLKDRTFSMDRTRSGVTAFSEEFPAVTVAPIEEGNEFTLRLFVDKASIEAFGDGGRFVMTNLVFPTEPYNRATFYSEGGSYRVTDLRIYTIEL
ncbi:MAG: DUF4980 domain-containing protein [Bacteroides sp.]|nr:DUF4980 domain-containing protein [Bacteroides sp.]